MISAAVNLDAFLREESAFARVIPAGDLFSLLTRQVLTPPACHALVWGDAVQPWFVPAGRPIESGPARDVLFVKALPIPLDYEITPLHSRDGIEFNAAVWIAVQAIGERSDLEQLRHLLLGSRNRADVADLKRHCEEPVRRALSVFAGQQNAAELVRPESWPAFNAVLAEHFQPVGFASGLALGGDIRVTFDSPEFIERQRDAAAATRRKMQLDEEAGLRAAAAQARKGHLDELASLLERLKSTAAATPGASMVDLIRTFDVSRRGELYRGLMSLGASQRRTEAILVVAGQELLWFPPTGGDAPSRRETLPQSLGPLRSIRVRRFNDRRVYLVGARKGVFLLEESGNATPFAFEPRGELRGGVNSAEILGDSLYATHSEAGLVSWRCSDPASPRFHLPDLTTGAKALRDVQAADDGRLWFTVDSRAIGWRPDDTKPPITLHANAPIQSLLAEGRDVFAGLDSGAILHWDLHDTETANVLQSPGGNAVHALVRLSGGGAPRLLTADKRTHLTLRVLGESYHAEYRWKKPLRWAAGADDVIVAVDDLRDSLVLWRPDVPEEPTATIGVARAYGHAIQDIAIM